MRLHPWPSLAFAVVAVVAVVAGCGADEEAAVAVVVDVPPIVLDEIAELEPRVDVDAGRALFLHSWTRGDLRSRGGDGLGPLFNASSCVACHDQGGVGGGGGNHHNVVVGDGRVFHRHGGGPMPRAATAGLGGLLLGAGSGPLGLGSTIAAARRRASWTSSTPAVSGALERVVVERAVARLRAQLLGCYNNAPGADPNNKGRVTLRWIISDVGRVSTAAVVGTTLREPAVERCLLNAIRRGLYPSSAAPTSVVWQLTFKSPAAPPSPPPPPTIVVERSAPALFGAGLIESVPEEVIEAAASTSIAGHPEISGKVGRDADGRVTRFGWKADVADLLTFVSRACSVELGLEVPGSPQPGSRRGSVAGLDIDLDDLEGLVGFVRALPRPIEARGAMASEGGELFDGIGCTGCHTAALGDVDGLYSDLLLHDMGVDLDDNSSVGYYGAPAKSGSAEWRTPPLWGVRDSAPYLHDGRARTLQGAIALHGGEAWRARQGYYALDVDGKAAVIAFLESLQAPRAP